MRDRVICQQCAAEGEKSTVTGGGSGMRTLMYCAPFYDEKGRYHSHDSNTTTYHLRCSRGHSWTEKTTGSCWCGWPNKKAAQLEGPSQEKK